MTHRNSLIPSTYEANTPSDTAFVDYVGVYVGVGGDLVLQSVAGTSVTFKNVPTGAVLPVRVIRVMSTSTTATNIVGLKA
jgi:hypothetical protein